MIDSDFKLDKRARGNIANAFSSSRWNYYYVRGKLASDPLYLGVGRALAGCDAPVLDLGCGIGLLAHALAAGGLKVAYTGLDNDAGKIRQAEAAAHRAGMDHARFICTDLSEPNVIRDLGHRGSVVMLDLLQFVPPGAQIAILQQAADAVSPTGRMVIRTGLAGKDWRSRITRAVDRLSVTLRWMNTGPKRYPERASLEALLTEAGLSCRFTPLWGQTPFNNWLIQAERPATHNGSPAPPKPATAASGS